MAEDGKFRLAECSNLCRKAKKEIFRKDCQNRAFKEYRKLVSGLLAYSVKKEFNIVKDNANISVGVRGQDGSEVKNLNGNEFKTFRDLDTQSKMKDSLRNLITEIITEARSDDGTEDEKNFDSVKQSCLKEIHKLLGKWNKPTVKNFLKNSPLFEGLERTAALVTPVVETARPGSGGMGSTSLTLHGGSSSNPHPQQNPIAPGGFSGGMGGMGGMGASGPHFPAAPVLPMTKVEVKKDESSNKEKDWSNIKFENNEELLTLYLNQNNPSDSFKNVFKTSIEKNPNFPKSFDEVPVLKLPLVGKLEAYENKNFFGDYDQAQYVENGLGVFIDELVSLVKE
jgi:hypothetical protein